MSQERKSLVSLELKADAQDGEFRAVFSTFNAIDHHRDITVPGAFEVGKEVLVGAYQHDMFILPVGRGVIGADDERAWIDGAFFIDTDHGRNTYQTVKRAAELMEWSYIFTVTDSEERDDGVRVLKAVDVWSVDPVLRGAGIGTGTVAIKGAPRPFAEHAGATAEALRAFAGRLTARIDMRSRDRRDLSADDRERLRTLDTEARELLQRLEDALSNASTPMGDQALLRAIAVLNDVG